MYIKIYFFIINMQNRSGRLTLFKHRLNGLNAKQRVTNCIPFSVYENIRTRGKGGGRMEVDEERRDVGDGCGEERETSRMGF
jgi:hypothetical protein